MADLERDGYTILRAAVSPEAVRAALRAIGLGIRHYGLPGGAEHAACQHGTFLPELRDDPAIWGVLPRFAGTSVGAHPHWTSPGDSWAEPQILLRFPDEAPEWHEFRFDGRINSCAQYSPHGHRCRCTQDHPKHRPAALVPHVDEEPPWAGHEYVPGGIESDDPTYCGCGLPASDPIHVRRRYRAIVGVALTDHGPDDGALHVWPGSHRLDRPAPRASFGPEPVPLRAGDAVIMHPKLAHAGSLNLGHTWQARVYFRLLGSA